MQRCVACKCSAMASLRGLVDELLSDHFDLQSCKDFKGKVVLLRADFNVPISDGKVLDYSGVEAVMPTVQQLLKMGAKVAMMSHLGRPEPGMAKREMELQFSLSILTSYLQRVLGRSFVGVKQEVLSAKAVQSLRNGQVGHKHNQLCLSMRLACVVVRVDTFPPKVQCSGVG